MVTWPRRSFIVIAAAFAVGGAEVALAVAVPLAAAHIARSPDRLFEAAYAAAFCGLGLLVGR